MKLLPIFLVIFLSSFSLCAQESQEYKPIDLNLQLKNMHLWRGFAVSNAPILASNLFYQTRDEKLRLGVWGGKSFDGSYREFDYYISYQSEGFTVSLWDIYNFSTSDLIGGGVFDYDKRTTGRFIDLTLGYEFQDFPFLVAVSTIIHGRDSEFMSIPENPYLRSGDLRYSTYMEARYNVIERDKYQFTVFVGGAFSLRGAEDTFYTSKPGLNFMGFTFNKKVEIGEFEFPIQATPAWNPDANRGFFEIAVSFFLKRPLPQGPGSRFYD